MADMDLIRQIIGRTLLLRIGNRSVVIIRNRIGEGRYLDGSTPDPDKYGTKPFAMPVGAVKKKDVLMNILKGKYDEESEVSLFRSKKSGKLWVIIKKGYAWLREQSGRGSGKVDLTWTREFIRSLRVIDVNVESGEVTIGHEGDRNQKLAEWHNELGASRSKKIRKYLALTEEELQIIGSEE